MYKRVLTIWLYGIICRKIFFPTLHLYSIPQFFTQNNRFFTVFNNILNILNLYIDLLSLLRNFEN